MDDRPEVNPSEPLVRVRDLHVYLGRRGRRSHAVRGVDLELRAGECLALVGESGSGKSVTLRSLIGLVGGGAQVTAAELAVLGEDARSLTDRRWRRLRGRRIGVVLQDALVALDPARTVGAEVAETIRRHRLAPRGQVDERVLRLLADAGVPEPEVRARQYPHELSGGLRQRALIASALSGEPAVLLADEPTSALDVTVQRQVLDLLADIRRGGVGVLLVSHDLGAVARLADRVAVMREGRIVETADTEEILRRPTHPYTRTLIGAAPRLTRPSGGPARRATGPGSAAPGPTGPHGPTVPEPKGPTVPEPNGPVVIELAGVSVSFPGPGRTRRQAVRSVDLTVRAGRAVGLVGESGSGKSTLAQLVLGLRRPDSGTVTLRSPDDGTPLPAGDPRRVRTIQLIQQNTADALDPRWPVRASLTEVIRRHDRLGRGAALDRARDLLARVGLDDTALDRRPHELSGGQRQRVTIARALAVRPRVLLCDEAVSALDATVRAQVLDLLADLRAGLGLTLLFISHDLGVISRLCEEVTVLRAGAVVESGPVSRVFGAPRHPYTVSLVEAVPAIAPARPTTRSTT